MQDPRCASAQAGTKPALQPQPPNPSFISFPSPLSLSSPDGGVRRARWRWRRRRIGCRGGDGAAELCSPEVCAAMAGAQLRRASLVGALRRLLPRARDPSDPWRRRQGVRSGRWPAFRQRSAHGGGWQHAVVAGTARPLEAKPLERALALLRAAVTAAPRMATAALR